MAGSAAGLGAVIGRDLERGRLLQVIEHARAGDGSAILVCGEAGVGKSTLLATLDAPGTRVLRACGHEAEQHLAFAALIDLLAPVARRSSDESLGIAATLALESALAQSPGSATPLAACRAILGALLALSEHGPLLVIVDDAHWIDEASLEVLLYVARRIGEEHVALILSARPHTLVTRLGLAELVIEGLSLQDCRGLLGGTKIGETVIKDVHRRTGGNPLAFCEAVRRLDTGQRLGTAPLPELLAVGPALERAFAHEIAELSEPAQLALGVLAAHGSADSEALLQTLKQLHLDIGLLDSTEMARFVRRAGNGLEFTHPLLKIAVLQRLSPTRRREIHEALADALNDGDPARSSWHHAEATVGPHGPTALAVAKSAEEASRRGARAVAAGLYQHAAALATNGTDRDAWLLQAASCFFEAGRPTASGPIAKHLMATTRNPTVRADAAIILGSLISFGQSSTLACDMLRAEASRVAGVDPHRAVMVLACAFTSAINGLNLNTARAIAQEVEVLASTDPVSVLLDQTLRGAVSLMNGEPNARALLDPVAQVAEALSTAGIAEAGHLVQAVALADMITERWEPARAAIDSLLRRSRVAGTQGLMIMAYAIASEVGLRTGHWADAYVWAQQAEESFLDPDDRVFAQLSAFALQTRVEAHLGLTDLAIEHGNRALATATSANLQAHVCWVRQSFGLLALGQRNYTEAARQLEVIAQLDHDNAMNESGQLWWAGDLIEAHVGLGRISDASEHIERLRAQGACTGRKYTLAMAARGDALIGSPADAEDAFARSIDMLTELGAPFEMARSQLLLAEHRAAVGGDVTVPREIALVTFERLGARAWSRRARELGTSEAPQAVVEIAAFDSLTPRELESAVLAARGHTNREIADELFLAPKTVEHQLGRVYRKLGIRSRTELAVAMLADTA